MSITEVLSGARRWHVACADAFAFAEGIPDGAVNLLFLDPPYNIGKADWDTFPSEAAFIGFIGRVLDTSRRILAPNGSLYLCAAPDFEDAVGLATRQRFALLNRIVWVKPTEYAPGDPRNTTFKAIEHARLRSYAPQTERVLFAEQSPSWPALLERERVAAGLQRAEVSARVVGTASGACWNWEAGIRFPSREHWEKLRTLFPVLPSFETIERPFAVSPAVPFTDCWTYPTVAGGDGKHSCEKPAAMLRDVIAASSRSGDLVCELFAGSGVGGEQAILAGRRYLGCDADPEWGERRGPARIRRAEVDPTAAGLPLKGVKARDKYQPSLFGDAP